jgi:hypothetical protein
MKLLYIFAAAACAAAVDASAPRRLGEAGRASMAARAEAHTRVAPSPSDVQAALDGGAEGHRARRRLGVASVGNFTSIVSVLDFGAVGDGITGTWHG